jgi:hypothetical protein
MKHQILSTIIATMILCTVSANADCPGGYSGGPETAYGEYTGQTRCVDAIPQAVTACIADMSDDAMIEAQACDAYCAVVPGCEGSFDVSDVALCDSWSCTPVDPITVHAYAIGEFSFYCSCIEN